MEALLRLADRSPFYRMIVVVTQKNTGGKCARLLTSQFIFYLFLLDTPVTLAILKLLRYRTVSQRYTHRTFAGLTHVNTGRSRKDIEVGRSNRAPLWRQLI